MLPDDLKNPETAAIGLDVSKLKGRSVAEVRKIVDNDDCALVIATEDVPTSLPREVMDRHPDEQLEGKRDLFWKFQTDRGEWRCWYGHLVDSDYVRRAGDPARPVVFAQVYTKRARATPGIRVRPIATLTFDLHGVCTHASDVEPQVDILRIRAEERQKSVQRSPTAKPRIAVSPDVTLDSFVRMFGLEPPTEELRIHDWDPDDVRTGQLGWTNDAELRTLILMNAQMDWRATVSQSEDRRWWLACREDATLWPPIAFDERGVRVGFRSPGGELGPAFDAYAARPGVRIVDDRGVAFAARVLIAHRRAPPDHSPMLVLLGRRHEGIAFNPAVSARLSAGKLDVTSPSGKRSLHVVEVHRDISRASLLISARRD